MRTTSQFGLGGGGVFAGCAAWGMAASVQAHSLECAVHVTDAAVDANRAGHSGYS